ncbi:MAG: hypothetical protein ABR881_12670 [Candidatus Sulfotelmatobacter sp.]|jgi:hypothetical protein
MTRINAFRTIAETRSMTWGKNTSALIFAAVLIVCSVTVGCSSDKPKPATATNQIPVTQPPSQLSPVPAPALQAENRPAPKKVVHKKPATVNYADKTYGLTFEYPRRYAIETGSAATDLLASNPIPMNFVQPGGVALAAVELPETSFANTDFSSAFFNVSVHKTLTADQCSEFAVPQPKVATQAPSTDTGSAVTPVPPTAPPSSEAPSASGSRLMLGDLELRATEAVTGEGTRQSDSKYFHVFQNGACYEFALNVTTVASDEGVMKHVDRDKVFDRLEKILATVKINPITAPEVTAEAPAQTPVVTPAQ